MATFSKCHYGGVWTDPSLARWYTLVPVLVSRLELVHAGETSELPLGASAKQSYSTGFGVEIFFEKFKKKGLH
jgi:hypothetical protein